MNQSSPTGGTSEEPFDVAAFARTTVSAIEYGDAMSSVLEDRVIRLEEVVAARWPRSRLLRRRLRREIRASAATWDPEYIPRGDFRTRRLAAVARAAGELHEAQERSRRAGWPEPGDADPGEGFLP